MTASTPPVRPLRLLVVEPDLRDCGAVRSTLRLITRWQRQGCSVRLVVVGQVPADEEVSVPPDVEVHHLADRHQRLRDAALPGLTALVREARRCDVVVAGREVGLGLVAAAVAATGSRTPLVVMVRSHPQLALRHHVPVSQQAATRWALRRARRLVCISQGLVPSVRALGVPRERVQVVLNGVEPDRIRAAAAVGSPPPPLPGVPRVVAVGRLTRQKGFDVLVRAHAAVLAGGRDAQLVIIGDGPDRPALERLGVQLGLGDRLSLPGFSPNPLPTVAAADLFCLPSRWEGFGQTLAEALVLGVPMVAADCVSGPSELLAGGEYGDLVPVDDVDALAAAIARHLREPARLGAAAEAGSRWAADALHVDRTAAQVLAVLAATGRGGPRPPRRAARRYSRPDAEPKA